MAAKPKKRTESEVRSEMASLFIEVARLKAEMELCTKRSGEAIAEAKVAYDTYAHAKGRLSDVVEEYIAVVPVDEPPAPGASTTQRPTRRVVVKPTPRRERKSE